MEQKRTIIKGRWKSETDHAEMLTDSIMTFSNYVQSHSITATLLQDFSKLPKFPWCSRCVRVMTHFQIEDYRDINIDSSARKWEWGIGNAGSTVISIDYWNVTLQTVQYQSKSLNCNKKNLVLLFAGWSTDWGTDCWWVFTLIVCFSKSNKDCIGSNFDKMTLKSPWVCVRCHRI